MAPVIFAIKKEKWAEVRVIATAQHRELLDQILDTFDIVPDVDFNIMRSNQGLTLLTARLLTELDTLLSAEKPDAVLAQGDTTTVFAVALACFYHQIRFGHVEAGLRTGDMRNPFPEEMNRIIATKFATWHFTPTEAARQNLLAEKISENAIYLTGNTVIDSLKLVAARQPDAGVALDRSKRLLILTAHRRENFGAPFREICQAVLTIVRQNANVQVLYPVHPNPNVQDIAHEILGRHPRIILCPPMNYQAFIGAMQRAYLILSDSGGIQEEAPALGKPVLVLRNESERPEAIAAGCAKLVGTDQAQIVRETQRLLDDTAAYEQMARGVSPYGDGRATARIIGVLKADLCA